MDHTLIENHLRAIQQEEEQEQNAYMGQEYDEEGTDIIEGQVRSLDDTIQTPSGHLVPYEEDEEPFWHVDEYDPEYDSDAQTVAFDTLQNQKKRSFQQRPWFRLLSLIALGLLIIALVFSGVWYYLTAPENSPVWLSWMPTAASFEPQAVITIYPTRRAVDFSYPDVVGPGSGIRVLSAPVFTLTDQRTTTGTVSHSATSATGLLTFYNAAPTSQTIAAGTVLSTSTGIQLVTNAAVILPAATLPTVGQAQVQAYTVQTGASSNLASGALYEQTCCGANVFVSSGVFSGGHDASISQAISPQDKQALTQEMTTLLQQKESLLFIPQAQETLTTPQCQTQWLWSGDVGTEASQLMITTRTTCQTLASTDALIEQQATSAASVHLSSHEQLVGSPQVTLGAIQGNMVEIQVQAQAEPLLTTDELTTWRMLVTGLTVNEVQTTLLAQQGIQRVSIENEGKQRLSSHLRNITLFVALN